MAVLRLGVWVLVLLPAVELGLRLELGLGLVELGVLLQEQVLRVHWLLVLVQQLLGWALVQKVLAQAQALVV